MTTQIAMRLPDEFVAYLDAAVASGRGKSRAELVARFIQRDLHRQQAEDDFLKLVAARALDDPEARAISLAALEHYKVY